MAVLTNMCNKYKLKYKNRKGEKKDKWSQYIALEDAYPTKYLLKAATFLSSYRGTIKLRIEVIAQVI